MDINNQVTGICYCSVVTERKYSTYYFKTGWGGLCISIIDSRGRWLLKGLCQVAKPVTREGQDGLVSGGEPCEGVSLENSGKRVETSMDKDYWK